ncbi:MAG: GNVR domain-containing protein [Chloroflexota bacterium]|nr:GNVR domain-containing protein [Chloroflexota bacterium]
MEEEIDLGKYIDVLLRWWWLIILGGLLAGGSAFLVSQMMPPTYEATAGVVTLKSRTELSLGSGFQSISDEDLLGANAGGSAIVDLNKRRLQSLTGMVTNGAIAQQVAEDLSDVLDEEEREPSALVRSVRGEVLEDSDTIQIIVSQRDPDKAAAIANAWARAFEAHANTIYGEAALAPFADIHDQVQEARKEYDQAQEALIVFLSEEDRTRELQRQVEEEVVIIANLRTGRQEDVSTVVNRQVQVQKRLFNTSVAAEVDANLRVLENQRDELLRQFERTYLRKQRLEDLLDEARLMREQLVKGGDASASTSGLALLVFKSRVFATADVLPFDADGVLTLDASDSLLPFDRLDLQLPSVDGLSPTSSAAEQISDLDGLISVMEEEIASLEASTQEQVTALSKGESYQFLESLSPEYLNVTDSQAALALLRMKDWEGMLSYSAVLNESFSQEITQLEDHVRVLQAEIVRLEGVKADLQQDRDLAWDAYNNLLSKEQELKITTASEDTEVRFASSALPPRSPVSPKKLMNTAVGLALGLMLGVFGAFLFDYLEVESNPRYLWSQITGARDTGRVQSDDAA